VKFFQTYKSHTVALI